MNSSVMEVDPHDSHQIRLENAPDRSEDPPNSTFRDENLQQTHRLDVTMI